MDQVTTCEQIFCKASAPKSIEPADQWIEKSVLIAGDNSSRKRVSFRFFPFQAFVVRAFQNEKVRRITAMVSTQCGKTTLALMCLTWMLRNRPRTTGWYTENDKAAKIDYKTKLLPYFETCPATKELLPRAREAKSQVLIQFDSMNLYILGAHTKANRERITLSNVFIDEARKLKPGALSELEGRFKTIPNFKRFMFSTAGKVFYNDEGEPIGDEHFVAFWRGSRTQFYWQCPHCGHKQTFRFGRRKSPLYRKERECGGFVWEINAKTMPKDDVYNFKELEKTVRYECENPECKHRFREEDKFQLIDSNNVEAIDGNPMAAGDDISPHWWEAYMDWCSWGDIVKKFLLATVAMKRGDIEPLKVFITDTLGEPWEEDAGTKPSESELLKLCGEYSVGEEWDKCQAILTADNQHGFVVFVYRIYTPNGIDSRLVDCGQLATFGELRAYQQAKKVKDAGVAIDCAYMPDDVFEACLAFGRWITPQDHEPIWNGWQPLLGDDKDEYSQRIASLSIQSYFSPKRIDVNAGKGLPRLIQRVSFSKDHYHEQLYSRAIKGKLGKWELPQNIEAYRPEYIKQLASTEKVPKIDARGQVVDYEWREKGRHDYKDCELFQLVMVDYRGVKTAQQTVRTVTT